MTGKILYKNSKSTEKVDFFLRAAAVASAPKSAEALTETDILVSPPCAHLFLCDQQLKGRSLPGITGVYEYV